MKTLNVSPDLTQFAHDAMTAYPAESFFVLAILCGLICIPLAKLI